MELFPVTSSPDVLGEGVASAVVSQTFSQLKAKDLHLASDWPSNSGKWSCMTSFTHSYTDGRSYGSTCPSAVTDVTRRRHGYGSNFGVKCLAHGHIDMD